MYQIDFNHPVRVFFVGIGGISMSGLARILASEGFTVSGSDRSRSQITQELEESGIRVYIGQRAENITDDIDLAVFTAAIHPDNPEYIAVQEKGIPSLTRAELLGQLMKNYRLPVAVSGTHGKTTTTSMLSEILLAARRDPAQYRRQRARRRRPVFRRGGLRVHQQLPAHVPQDRDHS